MSMCVCVSYFVCPCDLDEEAGAPGEARRKPEEERRREGRW